MRFVWSTLLLVAVFACGGSDNGGKDNPDAGPDGPPPCEGIGCKQVVCPGGGTTSISGTVFAPNGTLPIYNATVYVPLRPVAPITSGATCDRCTELSGNPLVRTVTDEQGRFTLNNVPATNDVPLVIQIGKWRRQVTIPAVPECTNTAIDTGMTRLPRNKTEGDIPKMALTTGEADALECLLRKIGLDDSEITNASGTGRVHLFAGGGGTDQFDAARGGAAFGQATALWANEASLSAYDVVFLSCEGGDNYTLGKSATSAAAMKAYADKGGRVFGSHWHHYWLAQGPAPWNQAITFAGGGAPPGLADLGTIQADIDTTFSKSADFIKWLMHTGALLGNGRIQLVDAQHTATAVNPTYAERWIHYPGAGGRADSVQYASLTTPLEAPANEKCGRVVLSDIHVASPDRSAANLTYPSGGCTSPVTTLTPQEKVLAFMIFDIASCVGDPIE